MVQSKIKESVYINDRYTVQKVILDNGMTVFLVPNKAAPLVSIYHWVKAGSLHEKKGITGIAHLFEHMMFRPIQSGHPNFHEKMRQYGGSVNANTRFESTVYETHVPEIYLKEAIGLEAERFMGLVVTNELLDIEREAVRSEYSTKFDSSPVIDLWFSIYNKAFPGHPFEWMIVGYKDDLDRISAKDCASFFERYYVPNNVGLVIAGNLDVEQTLEWVNDAYGDWKPGEKSELPNMYAHPTSYTHAIGKLESRTHMVMGGYRIPYIHTHDVLGLELLNHIVFDSSLNLAKRRLLDDQKMVSAVDGFNFHYDLGMIKFMVNLFPGVSIDDLKKQLKALRADLEALSEDQFESYLREFQIDTAESILANQDLAMTVIYCWGKYHDLSYLKQIVDQNIPVNKATVLRLFDQYLVEDNLVLVESPILEK